MKHPLVLEIKGNALDDGPGIRSVVFFKGCPLSCTWCHNPESKRTGVEIGFHAKTCVGCDTCTGVCPENALSRNNPFFIDRSACTLCFQCADTCPSGALSRIGTAMTIDEIVAKVIRDKPFYDTSGGGVTFSGGEPTLFMAFTGALAKTLKAGGIHTLLETCGFFDTGRFFDCAYPWLDMIYYDIKLIDPAAHARYCGLSNERILRNFKALHQRAQAGGVPVLPRIPLIPGITDADDNIKGIAGFLASLGVTQAGLLPYHPLWREKNHKIGIAPGLPNPGSPNNEAAAQTMAQWMNKQAIEKCRAVFEASGIRIL